MPTNSESDLIRKNYRLPVATIDQLKALARLYGSETKAIQVAVAMLANKHAVVEAERRVMGGQRPAEREEEQDDGYH